ncbi:hypothetical protein VNO80_16604 [Phaseolus coccineus]|uniref:Uncharacterized protein n=1 Tax=Phaseolus coccineus TaxID=3886 RepID=A0AAN9R0B6_PHACN
MDEKEGNGRKAFEVEIVSNGPTITEMDQDGNKPCLQLPWGLVFGVIESSSYSSLFVAFLSLLIFFYTIIQVYPIDLSLSLPLLITILHQIRIETENILRLKWKKNIFFERVVNILSLEGGMNYGQYMNVDLGKQRVSLTSAKVQGCTVLTA